MVNPGFNNKVICEFLYTKISVINYKSRTLHQSINQQNKTKQVPVLSVIILETVNSLKTPEHFPCRPV